MRGVKMLEPAVVETVTVAVVVAVPLNEAGFGETEQVDSAGAPVQVKAMVWLEPNVGASTRE